MPLKKPLSSPTRLFHNKICHLTYATASAKVNKRIELARVYAITLYSSEHLMNVLIVDKMIVLFLAFCRFRFFESVCEQPSVIPNLAEAAYKEAMRIV